MLSANVWNSFVLALACKKGAHRTNTGIPNCSNNSVLVLLSLDIFPKSLKQALSNPPELLAQEQEVQSHLDRNRLRKTCAGHLAMSKVEAVEALTKHIMTRSDS